MGALVAGTLEVRLAVDRAEVEAAQALRYRVFYVERGAQPSPEMGELGRDFDPFDTICDHLLVLDHSRGPGPEKVVGTYRLLRRSVAERHGRFYTADEYEIAPILNQSGELMELGRSCVDAAYRTSMVMKLLWGGIAAYVFEHDIDLMFGCASLPGNDPWALAEPLSYLYHYHLAPPAMRPTALPALYNDMALLPPERIRSKHALAALPPLIKGYLRLGGMVGDGAVVDNQFNTTDVCVVVKTDLVSEKYYRHYERSAREAKLG